MVSFLVMMGFPVSSIIHQRIYRIAETIQIIHIHRGCHLGSFLQIAGSHLVAVNQKLLNPPLPDCPPQGWQLRLHIIPGAV